MTPLLTENQLVHAVTLTIAGGSKGRVQKGDSLTENHLVHAVTLMIAGGSEGRN